MKRNIVLIGMPCSGKSSIGRMLSERLGRDLLETDEAVVRRAALPIPEIFQRFGEPYFRDLEARAVAEAAAVADGRVISTGGGVVLRGDNVAALGRTGKLVFLDRPLEHLLPTPDRPTANSPEKIRALYRDRYPLYRGAAEVRIDARGDLEEVLEAVLQTLREGEA